MTSPRPSAFRRCCAAVVAAALALQPLGAYAAPITTASSPRFRCRASNPVKPNIMFTVDDSGEYERRVHCRTSVGERLVTGIPLPIYCRDNAVSGVLLDPTRPLACGDVVLYTPRQYDPPIRSGDFNGQYYNPTATYGAGKAI